MRARIRSWTARLAEMFRLRRLHSEQDEELRFHLDMEIEHNRRLGMSVAEAERAARIAFGGVARFREEAREARGVAALGHLARDTRHAMRRLRRAPGYTLGALVTLGIGVGAAVGLGTIVHGVLLRPLPYPHAEELVRVSFLTPVLPVATDLHSEATFNHLAREAGDLVTLGAYYTNDGISVTEGEAPERVHAAMVSPSALHAIGVTPALGRLFAAEDSTYGNDAVLISHALWTRRFGGDPDILDRTITLNRGPRHIVGVLPRGFDFPAPEVHIWYPIATEWERPGITNRYLHVIGRLTPGADPAQAEAALNALFPRITERFPSIAEGELVGSGARVAVQSLRASVTAPIRPQLVLLGVMAGVILLLASTNVVNLLLLRVERAARETAVSRALGAGALDVARRFIVEGLLLGALSLIVALPMAALVIGTRLGFTAREIPRLHEVALGPRALTAVVVAALVVGALVGLAATARAASHHAGAWLRSGVRLTPDRFWRRVQNGLVVVQLAMAMALIVTSALMARSFWNMRQVQVGFARAGATSFDISLPYRGYSSYAESSTFHARVLDRLEAMPGVVGAAAVLRLPLSMAEAPEHDLRLRVHDGGGEGERIDVGEVLAIGSMATPDYFGEMQIPLLSGRSFLPGDLRRPEPGVVISQTLAAALFGDRDPVGRRLERLTTAGVRGRFTVVGVAGDVHAGRIEGGLSPMVYFPLLRDSDGLPVDSLPIPYVPRAVAYVVRGAPLPSAGAFRDLIRQLDPKVPILEAIRLETLVDRATARTRLTMLLVGAAGAAALLLGVVGVYSVLAYGVAGRLREFAVRLALGASPARISRTVLTEGAALAAVGIGGGVVLALVAGRTLRALLFEVSPTSITEYLGAVTLLLAVSLAAMLLPATRAARTEPATVLREE